MRKALKTIGIVLLAVVILAGGLIGYLTITEFRPASVQDAAQTAGQTSATLRAGESIRVLTFNTGYAGLDKSQDFFMDGGSGVSPAGGRDSGSQRADRAAAGGRSILRAHQPH